nr:hypothetical protein [Tanacetum cinerariifolium]
MAPLPPREQRHPFLRYQGLEYSNQDIADFEERLERIHDRGTDRAQVLDFEGMPKLMRDVLYARMRIEHHDSDGVMLGGARRRMSWREFILALGLHTGEEMKSLSFARARCWIDQHPLLIGLISKEEGDAGGVAKEAPVAPKGGDEDEEMPQAVPPPPRTYGERLAMIEEDVHEIHRALGRQREVLDSMAHDFSRFKTGSKFSTIVREYVTEPSMLSKSRAELRRESVNKSVEARRKV